MRPPLKIFIEMNEQGEYQLMCDDRRMSPAPCGARLFRAPPYPVIKFLHETMEAAERDADKLRAYLAGLTPKKLTRKQLAEI